VIRVLVVDDSAVVRKVLTQELSKFDGVEVVGSAMDPYVAREKIAELEPDVLTLDIEMPRMDGLSFLERLMEHYPMPVVIVSSLAPEHSETALRALQLGAVEVVAKPGGTFSVPEVGERLVHAIRAAAQARVRPRPSGPAQVARAAHKGLETSHKVLAIGASTGGTQAIEVVLRGLPRTSPGTVIVQHMPATFTGSFAARLNQLCEMEVREARDGDAVVPGMALLAPGGLHMVLHRSGAKYLVQIKDGPPVHHQRPAVDVLFGSVARQAGRNAVGAILTGMGADGAQGLLEMHQRGAHTIAEDEKTCVVFGMPREAIRLGAADEVVPLDRIAQAITDALAAVTTAA
jgi:two-component system, chemotaxis family, protein-glutamate methylesterase/glutaminase